LIRSLGERGRADGGVSSVRARRLSLVPALACSVVPHHLEIPLLVWSDSALSTYFVWHLHGPGHPWQLPDWIMLLEYGPVVTAAGFMLVRKSPQPAMSVTEVD